MERRNKNQKIIKLKRNTGEKIKMIKTKIFLIIVLIAFSVPIIAVKGDNYFIQQQSYIAYNYVPETTFPTGTYILPSFNTSSECEIYPFEWITYTDFGGRMILDTANKDCLMYIIVYDTTNGTHLTGWVIGFVDCKKQTNIMLPVNTDMHFDSRLISEQSDQAIFQSNKTFSKYTLLVIGIVDGVFNYSGYGMVKVTAGVYYIDVTPDMFNRIMHPETIEDLMLFIILFPFTLMFHNNIYLFFIGVGLFLVELALLIVIIKTVGSYLW